MHWIVRVLPGCQVTAGISAIGRGNLQVVVIVDVALLAGHVGVPRRERKIDWWASVVAIERGSQPAIKRLMTTLAIRWREVGGISGMRRIRGLLPVGHVTGLALGGQSVEDPGSRLLVAVFALDGGVGTE